MNGVKNALNSFMGLFGKKDQAKPQEVAAPTPAKPEPAPVVAAHVHHHPAQPEAKEPPAEVPPKVPEASSEKSKESAAPTPGPVVPREDFDGRMKMLVERLYEDESLRSDLTDDEAGPLLDWAMNDLMERLEKVYKTATSTQELEQGMETQYDQTKSLIMAKKKSDNP